MSEAAVETAAARDRRMARLIAAELRAVFEDIFPEQPFEPQPFEPPREWTDVILGSAAPGASYTYTVSATEVYPLSVFCRLITSAVVGDRSIALEYQFGTGQRYCVDGANLTQAAGQQNAYCWHPEAGARAWPVGDVALAPLPQQTLTYGRLLVIRLTNGDVADQIDQIAICARLSVPTNGDAPAID